MGGGRHALLGEGRVWPGGSMLGWNGAWIAGGGLFLCQIRFLTQAWSD